MRGVTKLLFATALLALFALGLAACGGGDSDDSTAASTATTTERTAPTAAPEDNRPEQEKKEAATEPEDDQGGSADSPEDSGSSPEDSGSSSDDSGSDGGASKPSSPPKGSASFRTPGGDNSIQNYGSEADEKEREAASEAVLVFLEARSKGDWDAVCSQMAAATLKPLEQLSERAPQFKDKGCPEILAVIMGGSSAAVRASTIRGGIDSLRFEGKRGFALYHGTDGKDYFLPLVKEGGEWKIGTLSPSEFTG